MFTHLKHWFFGVEASIVASILSDFQSVVNRLNVAEAALRAKAANLQSAATDLQTQATVTTTAADQAASVATKISALVS